MLLAGVLLFTALVVAKHLISTWNFPPGPLRVPVLGTISLFFSSKFNSGFLLKATELGKLYGSVIGVQESNQACLTAASVGLPVRVLG